MNLTLTLSYPDMDKALRLIAHEADEGAHQGAIGYDHMAINGTTILTLLRRLYRHCVIRLLDNPNKALTFDFTIECEDDFHLIKLRYG